MKRLVSIAIMMMAMTITFAQSPSEDVRVEKLKNGEVKVVGVDPLGADVMVLYSSDLVKTYQERTVDGVTTFARFSNGSVTEYGSFDKPLVQNLEAPGRTLVVEK